MCLPNSFCFIVLFLFFHRIIKIYGTWSLKRSFLTSRTSTIILWNHIQGNGNKNQDLNSWHQLPVMKTLLFQAIQVRAIFFLRILEYWRFKACSGYGNIWIYVNEILGRNIEIKDGLPDVLRLQIFYTIGFPAWKMVSPYSRLHW